tara:strand:- start:3056 stop:3274 length:219 start_codon:yes stop_codon:yes gene_type:complete
MSKNKIDELNMVSRFFGDVFDNLKNGTADRIIKQVKKQGMPKDVIKSIEQLNKDSEKLRQTLQKLKKYNKKK